LECHAGEHPHMRRLPELREFRQIKARMHVPSVPSGHFSATRAPTR
jgi:hypothetical protein